MTDERPDQRPPRWEPAPDLYGQEPAAEERTVAQDAVDPGAEAPTTAVPTGPPDPTPVPGPDRDPTPVPGYRIPAPPVAPPPPGPPGPPPDGPPFDPYGPDAEADDDGTAARNKKLAIAAVVLAFIAAIVVTVVVVSNDGDDDGPASTTTTSSTAPTTSTTVVRGEVPLEGGVRAIIPAGSLTPGASLTSELVDLPGDLGALTAAGPVLDLQVENGRLVGPIDLVFPLRGAPVAPAGGDPVVLGVHAPGGSPTFPTGDHDAVKETFVLRIDTPGIVGPATWRWTDLAELARTTFRDLADGDAPSPAGAGCAGDLDPAEVRITGAEQGIEWCAETDGDARRIVAANRTAFPITIGWSGSVEAARDAGTGTATELARGFADWTTSSSLTLAPGERATFRVPAGEAVTLTASADPTAGAATALLGDLAFVAALQGVVPGADGTGSLQGVLDRIDPGCAKDAGAGAGSLLAACFPEPTLRSIMGGPAASLAGPLTRPRVLGLAVDEAFGSVASTRQRRSTTSIELTAREIVSWPVDDQSATPALLAWLDEMGEVHDWARCVADACVAGLGDRVAYVEEEGGVVVNVGEVDADSADPYEALLAIGVPDVVADALVDRF